VERCAIQDKLAADAGARKIHLPVCCKATVEFEVAARLKLMGDEARKVATGQADGDRTGLAEDNGLLEGAVLEARRAPQRRPLQIQLARDSGAAQAQMSRRGRCCALGVGEQIVQQLPTDLAVLAPRLAVGRVAGHWRAKRQYNRRTGPDSVPDRRLCFGQLGARQHDQPPVPLLVPCSSRRNGVSIRLERLRCIVTYLLNRLIPW
jgi:hypothetical protein